MSSAVVVDDLGFAWPDVPLVVSHDLPFLGTIGITRWLRLDGRLAELAQAPPSSPAPSQVRTRRSPGGRSGCGGTGWSGPSEP
jgi:hypothetical protein